MQGSSFQKIMFTGLVLFGVIFGLVINLSTPTVGKIPMVGFFVSLFFLILCSVSLFGYLLKKKATNNELNFSIITGSLRQGLLAAIFVDSILALSGLKLLTWWDGVLLAISLILLELYFKSEKKVNHVQTS